MLKKLSLSLCILSSLSLPPISYAFDLFDQDRGKIPEPPAPPVEPPKPPPPPPPPPKPVLPPPPQKDFSLQGTSQFGDDFRAILVTPQNQVSKINWQAGGKPVALSEGFRLLKIAARQVIIEYPANSPCREDRPSKGVDCDPDGKTATLNLVIGRPTPNTNVQAGIVVSPAATTTTAEAQVQEAARERARQVFENAARRAGNNIEPDEVPPGMRVVKTPFGDRLVPIK